MGVVVDLLSGQAFLFDSSGGGGGTGITMPYPEVNFYTELPDPTSTGSTGAIYVVRQGMGTYTADRLDGGLYYSNGVVWSRLGFTPAYFNDDNFNIYNGSDKSKRIRLELSRNTSGTTHTIHARDSDGTMSYVSDLISSGLTIAHEGNSTYTTLQDFLNACDSSGVINGLDIYDIGGGFVQITSGTTLLRKTTSTLSTLEFINYSGGTIAIPPDGALWYLGLSYNNGSPIVALSPVDAWNNTDQIQLGSAIVLPIGILVFRNQHTSNNLFSKITQRFEADGFAKRDDHVGGLMLGETGTRNVTLTPGIVWAKLNKFDISAIDTSPSGGDFLFNFYLSGTTSGGTWAVNTDVHYDNIHYNNVNDPNGLVMMTDGYFTN